MTLVERLRARAKMGEVNGPVLLLEAAECIEELEQKMARERRTFDDARKQHVWTYEQWQRLFRENEELREVLRSVFDDHGKIRPGANQKVKAALS